MDSLALWLHDILPQHAKSTLGLERIDIDLAGQTLESALTSA